MEIVEWSGLFYVIGPDGQLYGRGATHEMAKGLVAWAEQEEQDG